MYKTIFCEYCNKEVNTKLKTGKETFKVRGTSITVDRAVRVCRECGRHLSDIDVDDKTMEMVYNKYKTINGMLLPDEIKEIRNKLNLSQKELADLTGLSEKSISRFENGSLQTKEQDDLIRKLMSS